MIRSYVLSMTRGICFRNSIYLLYCNVYDIGDKFSCYKQSRLLMTHAVDIIRELSAKKICLH